jgi:hypothetical protein
MHTRPGAVPAGARASGADVNSRSAAQRGVASAWAVACGSAFGARRAINQRSECADSTARLACNSRRCPQWQPRIRCRLHGRSTATGSARRSRYALCPLHCTPDPFPPAHTLAHNCARARMDTASLPHFCLHHAAPGPHQHTHARTHARTHGGGAGG